MTGIRSRPSALLLLCLLSSAVRADAPASRPVLSSTETRAAFLKLIDRPRVELAAKDEAVPLDVADAGLTRIAFSYASEAGVRVPGILVKDEKRSGRMPAVILAHGTGGNKEGQLPLMRRLAKRGFVAVAIDGRYHGHRTEGKGTAEYNAAIAKAFADNGVDGAGKAHPLYFDTVWDQHRLLDYLQSRDDVDPKRIGMIGFSKGGIETFLAAASDERIAVAVPCIGVQSFAYGLDVVGWKSRVGTFKGAFDAAAKQAGVEKPDAAFARRFYDHVLPGIYDRFDGPAMLPAIAPRPLLVINGAADDKTPVPGVELCASAARKAYTAANQPERFKLINQPETGHQVKEPALAEAVGWFERWLMP
jgi:dienelactone hydrolase